MPMYIPKQFREDDLTTLQAFIHNYPFATLISQQESKLVASHIPLTFHSEQGAYGTLFGHVALGNQQWRTFDDGQEVLVIFQGPHAYISASWYEEPTKTVPTWNYAVVHAYGTVQKIDEEKLLHHLMTLAQTFEAQSEQPWTFYPQSEWIRHMARGIVGFAIPITQLEGKFKLNQNRSEQDQERVAEALRTATDSASSGVAALMQANIHEHKE